MAEIIGAIGVELYLDRSRFDQEIQKVSQAAIPVNLKLETAGIQRQLQDLRSQTLTVKVDDSALTRLNQHLERKREHLQEVNRYFASNPIKVRVDDSELTNLNQRLAGLTRQQQVTVGVKGDFAQLEQQLAGYQAKLAATVSQKIALDVDTSKFEDAISNSVERAFRKVRGGGIGSVLSGLLAAPLQIATGAIGGAGSAIAQGLTLGATQEITRKLGSGINTAIEQSLSQKFGSSELIGEKLGEGIVAGINRSVSRLNKIFDELPKALEQAIDQIPEATTRAKLKKKLLDAQEFQRNLSQGIQSGIQQTFPEQEVLEEGLATRSRRTTARQQRRTSAQNQSLQEFRDAANQAEQVAAANDTTQIDRLIAQQQQTRQQALAQLAKSSQLIQRSTGLNAPEFIQQVVPIAQQRQTQQFEADVSGQTIKDTQSRINRASVDLVGAKATGNQEAIADLQLRIQEESKNLKALEEKRSEFLAEVAKYDEQLAQFGDPKQIISLANQYDVLQSEVVKSATQLQQLEQQRNKQIAAINQALQGKTKASQNFQKLEPEKLPQNLIDVLQATLGDRFDQSNLPQLRVSDRELMQTGQLANYNPGRNLIKVRSDLRDRLYGNEPLSEQEFRTISEEIAHSADLGMGSYKGVQSAAMRRVLPGREVMPTAEELAKIGPELAMYRPEDRAVEANAKVQALRAFGRYQGIQRQRENLNLVSDSSRSAQSILGDTRDLRGTVNAISVIGDRIGEDVSKVVASVNRIFGNVEEGAKKLVDQMNSYVQEFGLINADTAKLKEINQGINQLERQYSGTADLAGSKAKELFSRPPKPPADITVSEQTTPQGGSGIRDRIVEGANVAGRVARAGVDAAQAIVQSPVGQAISAKLPQVEQIQLAASYIRDGVNAVGKALYKGAEVIEQTAFAIGGPATFLPANAAKAVMKPLASSGLAFARQNFLIPTALGVGSMMLPEAGGLVHSLSGLTHYATDPAMSMVGNTIASSINHGITGAADWGLNALGHSGNLIGRIPGMGWAGNAAGWITQGAANAARPLVMNATGQVANFVSGATSNAFGSSLVQQLGADAAASFVVGKGIQDVYDKAVPQRQEVRARIAAAKDDPLQLPMAQPKEAEMVAVERSQSQQTSAQSARETIKNVANQAGRATAEVVKTAQKAADVTKEVVQAVQKTQEEIDQAIAQYRQIIGNFRSAYQNLQQFVKAGDTEKAQILAQTIQDTAPRAQEAIKALRSTLSPEQLKEGNLGARLAGQMGEIGRKANLAQSQVRKMRPDDVPDNALDVEYQRLDLNKGIARLAGVEPRDTFPRTIRAAIGSDRFKDLAVNSAGLGASLLAGTQGPVAGLAGDLLGAIAMRNALGGGTPIAGDLMGFAIGNLTNAATGIPGSGAAMASAVVPQLQKMMERFRGASQQSNQPESSLDVEFQRLNFGDPGKRLQDVRKKLLNGISKFLEDEIKAIDAYLQSGDEVGANRQATRSLTKLNRIFENVLKRRSDIVDDIFQSEMNAMNEQLLNIGRRAQRRDATRTDPEFLYGRAVDNQLQRDVAESTVQMSDENRRAARQTNRLVRAGLVEEQLPLNVTGDRRSGFWRSIIGPFVKEYEDFQSQIKDALLNRSKTLLTEAQALLREVQSTKESLIAQGAPKESIDRLTGIQQRLQPQVRTASAVLDKNRTDVTDADIARLQKFEKATRDVFNQVDRPLPGGAEGPFSKITAGLGNAIAGVQRFAGLIGTVIGGFIAFQLAAGPAQAIAQFAKESFLASVNLEKFSNALNFASGSAAAGARNLEFVRKQAEELNVPLGPAIEGFTKLAASTRGTAVEGKATQEVFKGIADAATVFGLSADETSGALLALSQVASKGTVQSEELRGQLGERIPGAFAIAARAIGVTEKQLGKMLEQGQVLSEDFLPKFGKQLQLELGDAAEKSANSAQGAINKLGNEFLKFQQTVGDSTKPAITAGLNILSEAIKTLSAIMPSLITLIGAVSAVLLTRFVTSLGAAAIASVQAGTAMGTLRSSVVSVREAFGKVVNNPFVGATLGAYVLISGIQDIADKVNSSLVQSYRNAEEAAKAAAQAAGAIPTPGNGRPDARNDAPGNRPLNAKDFTPAGPLDLILRGIEGQNIDTAFRNTQQTRSRLLGSSTQRLTGLSTSGGAEIREAQAQLDAATIRRNTLRGQAEREFTARGQAIPADLAKQVAEAEEAVKRLSTRPTEAREKFTTDLNAATKQIDAIKAQLEALKDPSERAKLLRAGVDVDAQEKELKESLSKFQDYKRQAEFVLGSLNVDPIQSIRNAFTDLANAIAEADGNITRFGVAQRTAITRDKIRDFGTDRDAGINAQLRTQQTNRESIQQQINTRQAAIANAQNSLNNPEATAALGEFGLSINSTVEEIDRVLNRLPQNVDAARKDAVEKLKGFRQSKDDVAKLGEDLANADDQIQQTLQQRAIARIERFTQERDNLLKRRANAQQINNIGGQITEFGLGLSPQNAAIRAADRNVTQAQNDRANTEQEIINAQQTLEKVRNDGALGEEERARRSQELITKISDLQAKAAQQDLAVKEAVQKRVLTLISEEATARENATKRAESRAAEAISARRGTLARASVGPNRLTSSELGIAEADIGVQQARDSERFTQQRSRAIDTQLSQLRNYYQQGKISSEEFYKREQELLNQQADSRARLAENRAAVEEAIARKVEATNRKIIEGLELANQRAEAAIAITQTTQTQSARQNLLGSADSGAISEQQLGRSQALIDQQAAQERLRLKQQELQQNRQLVAQGIRDRVEGQKIEIGLLQEIARLNLESTNAQLESLKQLREAKRTYYKEMVQLASEEIDRQSQLLDAQQKLIDASRGLQKALNESAQSGLQSQLNALDKAVEVSKGLKSGQFNAEQTQVANEFLQQQGLGGKDETQILLAKQQIEDEIAKAKAEALVQEIEGQKITLEIEREKFRLAQEQAKLKAQSAVIDAQVASKDAEVAKRQAQRDLANAKTPEQAATAQANLEIADLKSSSAILQLSGALKSLDNIDRISALGEQSFDKQRQALDISGDARKREFAASDRLREFQQSMDLAAFGRGLSSQNQDSGVGRILNANAAGPFGTGFNIDAGSIGFKANESGVQSGDGMKEGGSIGGVNLPGLKSVEEINKDGVKTQKVAVQNQAQAFAVLISLVSRIANGIVGAGNSDRAPGTFDPDAQRKEQAIRADSGINAISPDRLARLSFQKDGYNDKIDAAKAGMQPTDKTPEAFNNVVGFARSPYGAANVDTSVDRFFQDRASSLSQSDSKLIDAFLQAVNKPTNLYVSTPDAPRDAANVYRDIIKERATNSGL